MSGFPQQVRNMVFKRAGGRCERCGLVATHYEWHHRRPRGMGGSKAPDTNVASNCLLLCPTCHRVVEQHRQIALDRGYLVGQSEHPGTVPVWRYTTWVFLTDTGTVVKA